MARIDDVFITDTFNFVLFRRMGKPCVHIKREHIKQTTATKKRGINFGIEAKAGKGLRNGSGGGHTQSNGPDYAKQVFMRHC